MQPSESQEDRVGLSVTERLNRETWVWVWVREGAGRMKSLGEMCVENCIFVGVYCYF